MARNYTNNKSVQEEYSISYSVTSNPISQSTNGSILYPKDLGYINTKREEDSKQIIDGYFPQENLVKALAIK